MGKVYEMLWDCKFCGQEKLLAKTNRTCTQCGAAQDPAWRYFPSDSDKVEVQNHTFVGKDKLCPACDSVNAADNNFCIRCGAPMAGAEVAGTVPSRSKGAGEDFETQNLKALQRAQKELAQLEEAAQRRTMQRAHRLSGRSAGRIDRALGQPISKKTWALLGGGLTGMLGVGGIIAALLSMTVPVTVEVTGHTWQRRIAIEAYEAQAGSDWKDGLPSAAYNVSCRSKQRSTNRIPDGETCSTRQVDQGDGTFREESYCTTDYREEPVYDDYCSYTVNRWAVARWASASGRSLAEAPTWPPLNARTCATTSLGCERAGRRRETYTLQLLDRDSGETYRCDRTQPEWQVSPVGTPFQLEVGRILGDARCGSLARSN
ncbi:MAG: zinc ribbon domain-containing protein [Cyanobacteria bacterium J06632_22]